MLIASALLLTWLVGALPVAAHNVGMFVYVSYKAPGHLTVKFQDAYGSPIEAAGMAITTTTAGAPPGLPQTMTELPGGVYTYQLAPGSDAITLKLETNQQGELYGTTFSIDPRTDSPEQMFAMNFIALPGGLAISRATMALIAEGLFVGGAVLAALLLRAPKPKPKPKPKA
jgi:hypothetical protein